MRIGRIVLVTVLGGVVLTPASGWAQNRRMDHVQQQAQQQDRLRQHVQQMDEQLQRMDRIRDRIQRFERDCAQQLDRVQDQDRLQEHQRLRDMARSMSDAMGPLRENLQRTREMARNPRFDQDPELQQQMERLRNHWREMLGQLDESVASLERIQKQLGGES